MNIYFNYKTKTEWNVLFTKELYFKRGQHRCGNLDFSEILISNIQPLSGTLVGKNKLVLHIHFFSMTEQMNGFCSVLIRFFLDL